jgi:hypothetical protein
LQQNGRLLVQVAGNTTGMPTVAKMLMAHLPQRLAAD